MVSFIKSKKFLVTTLILLVIAVLSYCALNAGVQTQAFKVKREDVIKAVTVTGTIQSPNDIGVETSITAKIKKIFVDKGAFVKKGQILAILDKNEILGNLTSAEGQLESNKAQVRNLETEPRIQQANIARAQVQESQENLNSVQQDLSKLEVLLKDDISEEKRFLVLYQQGALSFRDYEKSSNARRQVQANVEGLKNQVQSSKARFVQAKQNLSLILAGSKVEQIQAANGQVKSAVGNVQSIESKLDNYTIRAPFSGYIAQKILDIGQVSSPSIPILRLVKPESLYINAEVEENQLKDVKVDQKAIIVFDAYPAQSIQGKTYLISKNVDPITGTFDARVRIPIIKNLPIVVGMTSDVSIVTKELHKILIIPSEFVNTKNKIKFVFLKKGKKLVKRDIQGAKFSNNKFIVTNGLKENDIILKGIKNRKLKENNIVKIHDFVK